MPEAARDLEPAIPEEALPPVNGFKKKKFNVFLVTDDDTLWPLVGADLSGDLLLKQLDSIDELLAAIPAGQPGIVLWDARGQGNFATGLSRLNLHSSCFAVVVLDDNGAAGAWTIPLQQRQVVAHVGLPLSSMMLGKALEAAREEVGARSALLGEPPSQQAPPVDERRIRWLPMGIGVAVVLAGAVTFMMMRDGPRPDAPAAGVVKSAAPIKISESPDDKVDALIEKAQQAMLERHFIEPAAGSALSLYRDVLLVDPNNGEARQGLQRLEEILITRVQSAMDEHKFDLALQSLETARSIDPDDQRLSALDERIASQRAELGPAQIAAALNAQNFERAAQLIDDAARAKSIAPAKLAQLREELRQRQGDAESSKLLKLIDARLQQGKLTEPRNDCAVFYLEQARIAGVPPAALQAQYAELQRQQTFIARAEKEQAAARAAAATPQVEQPKSLEPTETRLAQGRPPAPDNDSAAAAAPGRDTNVESAAAAATPATVTTEQSLTRLNKLDVVYPPRAMDRGLEGWVDIGFKVNTDGTVSDVVALSASPVNTFEQAGIKAVSKLRYQPVMQAGRPVAVNSHLRVVFRMPK